MLRHGSTFSEVGASENPGAVHLRQRGIVTKRRTLKTGRTVGGIPFTRGPLAYLLRNRFYIGEVVFRGEVFPGEQPAILDRDLFNAVQVKLSEQLNNHTAARAKSESPLIGRIHDDRGNRMSPSHARKDGIRYRYYVSSPLLQGHAGHAGSVRRAPAAEVEALVGQAVREHLKDSALPDGDLILAHVVRVDVQAEHLMIELRAAEREPSSGGENGTQSDRHSDQLEADRIVLRVPWKKPPSKRRREIIVPKSTAPQDVRPIRAETRATLVASIARGRRWLDEIVAGTVTVEQIAAREQCSIRQVNMTISLAFLAPKLMQAAVEGRLPRGIGVTRLRDAPAEWDRQYAMLGLSV
ncbi:MAG: recombinase family protein [Rhodoplanes sp.]